MQKIYGVGEARKLFLLGCFAQVAKGKVITITCYGRPIAMLGPVQRARAEEQLRTAQAGAGRSSSCPAAAAAEHGRGLVPLRQRARRRQRSQWRARHLRAPDHAPLPHTSARTARGRLRGETARDLFGLRAQIVAAPRHPQEGGGLGMGITQARHQHAEIAAPIAEQVAQPMPGFPAHPCSSSGLIGASNISW